MPLLTIHHKTEYRYARPVAFGEHRVMLRPRDGHDLRVLEGRLDIAPQPSSLRWIHDVFGNSVAIAGFETRADRLVFDSMVTVEHSPQNDMALTPGDDAWHYPFAYDDEELPDLLQSITPQYADPDGALERWALGFLSPSGQTVTIAMLTEMTHAVRAQFAYRRRHEHGTQHPLDTLATRSGTCRDFALLMIEALRRLGIAARFVSGYLFVPGKGDEKGHVGGGSTHAWVRAYLPGAGWVEFDPTNGIVGNRDLVRVAVARDPHQAIPLHGTFHGRAADYLGMDVSITVLSSEEAPHRPEKWAPVFGPGDAQTHRPEKRTPVFGSGDAQQAQQVAEHRDAARLEQDNAPRVKEG
jgi:transglutaminase-like putative cysteine protease